MTSMPRSSAARIASLREASCQGVEMPFASSSKRSMRVWGTRAPMVALGSPHGMQVVARGMSTNIPNTWVSSTQLTSATVTETFYVEDTAHQHAEDFGARHGIGLRPRLRVRGCTATRGLILSVPSTVNCVFFAASYAHVAQSSAPKSVTGLSPLSSHTSPAKGRSRE